MFAASWKYTILIYLQYIIDSMSRVVFRAVYIPSVGHEKHIGRNAHIIEIAGNWTFSQVLQFVGARSQETEDT